MADREELERYAAELRAKQSKDRKADKVERYRRLNRYVQKGRILFCGSSLMEQFPINELLMDRGIALTVYNRGVGGFTTSEMAEVLDTVVLELEPKHVFINIGTNDLNGPDYRLDGLIERYDSILRRIEEGLPGVKLYLLAYYPVNPEVGSKDPTFGSRFKYRTNTRIDEANEAVRALAARHGARYLDLNAGIKDADGDLKAEYTVEGLHMYADGYEKVLDELLPVLLELE